MEFQVGQDKFLKSKKTGIQILKGAIGTGKTTVSIYKAVDLERNYCIYEKDKVLLVHSGEEHSKKAKSIYSKAKLEMEHNFYSLFSIKNKEQIEFSNINQLIDSYVKSYIRENKLKLVYLDLNKKIEILQSVYEEFSKDNKLTKFIKNIDMNYLLEEIEWIKSNYFTRDEYFNVNRMGRGKSLRKHSESRNQIYSIRDRYSYETHKLGYMDKYDDTIFTINYSKKYEEKYSHIIIDDCEKLSRAQLIFMKNLKNEKHGSFILIINKGEEINKSHWSYSGKSISNIVGDTKGKNFILKNKFNNKKEKNLSFIEQYDYIDLNKGRVLSFEVDNGNTLKEVIVNKNGNDNIIEDDLIGIPVYSDIAAGNPILINDIKEGTFNIPSYFVGKNKNLFMLHVKGDSMIEKNINNGDFVIIKSQNSAYHNEIVAVDIDGSATLKTLNLNSEEPLLMPANAKYEPIKLKGKESNILGIVLGILKNKTN